MLVVDDEADLLATYERLLRREGYRVIAVGSRVAALAAVERERPHLVISDVRLADGDGLDVVRAARARLSPPPVIVVTGFPSAELRQAALRAGAVAFLAKPFQSSALLQLVRTSMEAGPC